MCDLFIVPQLYWCKNNGVDLKIYPKIAKVEQAVISENQAFDNYKYTLN